MLPQLLTNFELQKCYKNESSFNDVYSRNNLPKIKDGPYVINLDDYESIKTHWIALYVIDDISYFDRLGCKHIPKQIKNFVVNRNITMDIFRIQAYDSMCGYFCIGFIDFVFKRKSL